MRLPAVLVVGILGAVAASVFAQSPAPAPSPGPASSSPSSVVAPAAPEKEEFFAPEEQRPHFDFRWDFLGRYDRIENLVARPNIYRARFEVRPELDYVVSDRFRIGARAAGDWGTDRNTANDPNFDNYRSRGASLDRYFIEGKPGDFDLRLGSFGTPIVASEMLWDHDIQTLGAAASWQIHAGSSTFTIAGTGFRGPQREGDRTRVEAGQIVWRAGDAARFSVEVAGAFWNYDLDHLKIAFIRQNYSASIAEGGPGFVSRFQIADALVRFRFPIGTAPVLLSFDGLKNFGSREEARGDDRAFEGSVTVGSVGTPGQVRGFYTYQYVQREAVLGAYNTDDWWLHSWYRGHRAGLAITVLPQMYVQGTAMYQERLDRNFYIRRFTAELVKVF